MNPNGYITRIYIPDSVWEDSLWESHHIDDLIILCKGVTIYEAKGLWLDTTEAVTVVEVVHENLSQVSTILSRIRKLMHDAGEEEVLMTTTPTIINRTHKDAKV